MSYEWITAGTISQISHPSSSRISNRGAEAFMEEHVFRNDGFGGLLHEWPQGFWSAFEAIQAKGIYCVPIRVEGRLWGVLVFDDCHEAKRRSLSELPALRIAADCIGSTIQRQRTQQALLEAEQNRAAELAKANDALQRSLNRLASDRSLESFLRRILQEAIQMLDGATAQLFLYDAQTHTLAPSLGVDEDSIIHPEPGLVAGLPCGQSFPADVTNAWQRLLDQRSPIYFDVEQDAADFWPGTVEFHRSRGVHVVVCTALMLGDQPLGLLGLTFRDRTGFKESESTFFQVLAQQATLAIQLTRLAGRRSKPQSPVNKNKQHEHKQQSYLEQIPCCVIA